MDASGEQPQWSINEYLHDIDPDRWSGTIVEPANKIVADAFAIKNIIPNVSSAIFKNPGSLEILEDQQWKEMQICGDWVFYLHLLRGGVLAYSPDACNYYRIHGENTSVKSYSGDTYYAEHEMVAKIVQRYYRVNREIFGRQRLNLIAHWRETRPSFSEEAFEKTYSLSRIDDAATGRAPNLLMASYGFCSGGGETFPVELANLMKGSDYNITYLDCAQEPRNEGVRANLRIDIPVVSDFTHLEAIISDFGIDLVHSHHAWVDSTILDLLPPDLDCRTIVTLHGMYETINSVDLRFILPRLVKRSARLIYVADKNVSALKAHKLTRKEQLVRIENALAPADFEPVQRSCLGISEKAFVVTLISRGMVEKGWEEAIQIVGEARAISGNDIHLILVGDGEEYDRLLALNLPEYIHLEGFQRNVRGYFAAADVGILPSKFRGESSPLVIIECLQAGRPFLASTLGDIPYMLGSPCGLAGSLIDLDGLEIDISLWAKTIDDLASDSRSLELLQSRVSGAAKKFDAAAMTKKHDEVYRSVLGETGL
jgi:glycosyltransferase involved in cell wall biosynthesis